MTKNILRFLCFGLFLISVQSTNAQLTQLKPQFCGFEAQGWTNTNAYGIVYCEPVPGANKYKFKATGGSNDPGYIKYRANNGNYVILGQFGGMKDTTWYDISVAYSTDNGSSWSPYGSSCPVKTPVSPTTSLATQSCGIQLTDFNLTLTAKYMPYCNTYRFRIFNLPGNPVYDETVLRSNGPWYEVSTITLPVHFPNIIMGFTYNCIVQWNNGGDWKPYGDTCQITLGDEILMSSLFPDLTAISSAGGTIHNSYANNNLYILNNVGEPITHTYELYSGSGPPPLNTRILNQGFEQPSKWKVTILKPGPGVLVDRSDEPPITVYPNPFSDKLMVESNANRDHILFLTVLNTEGKIVEQVEVNTALKTLDLEQLYPGTYFFHFSDENKQKIETKKVIKAY